MTAQEFSNSLTSPTVFVASVGTPTGKRVALLDDTDFPFNLGDLTGSVDSQGVWQWDGEGDPTDDRGNNITLVRVYNDATEYNEQRAEYDAAF